MKVILKLVIRLKYFRAMGEFRDYLNMRKQIQRKGMT